MKSILISIKPKWVAKILNGEKTIEIRKTMTKCDLPIDVYIYCTKDKEPCFVGIPRSGKYTILNGKVVAKFTLNKVEEISWPFSFELMYRCKLSYDELCDEFVSINKETHHKEIVDYFDYTGLSKYDNYGAIWTDKGLQFVARMNDKGELELL